MKNPTPIIREIGRMIFFGSWTLIISGVYGAIWVILTIILSQKLSWGIYSIIWITTLVGSVVLTIFTTRKILGILKTKLENTIPWLYKDLTRFFLFTIPTTIGVILITYIILSFIFSSFI